MNVDLDELEKFLRIYRTGQIIYPSAMQRALHIQIRDVYRILELAVQAGACSQLLEVYCPKCQRFSGLKYDSVFDIPDEVYCIHCDDEIAKAVEHAIVVYKVI